MDLLRSLLLVMSYAFLFNGFYYLKHVSGANVTYDNRSLLIDGQRRVLISGSIHYPRSTPEMWPDIIQKAKDGGLDVIESYVFWNMHEPKQNEYYFEDRYDLVKFVKTVQQAGLLVHLRIGPYACAEWNYGGFPVWLHLIPGIQFRTDNEPFKNEMQRFTAKIVDMMKQEKLFASQGGPIILAQIENEYGNIDGPYGAAGKSYIKWAASMAVGLNTGVPWVMCQQADAPDPIINTCNGFYCDAFTPNSPNKPKMWTENWSGWFLSFGGRVPFRPTEDLAFSVARFFQRGGTFQNYYMYHGGTNFGRTTGGPFIATSYDYDAPIDEYGIVRQPKWGHLKELHKAIKLCETALVNAEATYKSFGSGLEAHVYSLGSGTCAAFLANINTQSDATVKFNGNSYHLPAWSVSILPDCKNVAFNTAKISSQTTSVQMNPANLILAGSNSIKGTGSGNATPWSWLHEQIGISGSNTFSKPGLLEQINTTVDASDYLWYTTSIQVDDDEPFLHGGTQPVLHVESLGHALHVFINGEFAGTGAGSGSSSKITLQKVITLKSGKNIIDLLSVTVGLQNYGSFFDTWGAGITGPVTLQGFKDGEHNLSTQQWTYQIGLTGEQLEFYSGETTASVQWVAGSNLPMNQPMIWYKTNFDAPSGSDPVALNLFGMGKGVAWVNGKSIGRYWPSYIASQGGCTDSCDYRGAYSSSKCLTNCGQPSQKLYHVPRSWIQPTGNVLVLFEELGGDPTQISFMARSVGTVCARVSETHLPPVGSWKSSATSGLKVNKPKAELQLHCPSSGHLIKSIKFASFGTPTGHCGSFTYGHCNTNSTMSIIEEACIGRESCSVEVSIEKFGDPCKGAVKNLAVEASCS